jgi:hypothetical protein
MAHVASRQQQGQVPHTTIQYKENPSRPMKAVEWHGKRNMKVTERPSPALTDPVSCPLRDWKGGGRSVEKLGGRRGGT